MRLVKMRSVFLFFIFCFNVIQGHAEQPPAHTEQQRIEILKSDFSRDAPSNWHNIASNYFVDLNFTKIEDDDFFVVTRMIDSAKLERSENYNYTQQLFQVDCKRRRLKRLGLSDYFSRYIDLGGLSGKNIRMYSKSTEYNIDRHTWSDFAKMQSPPIVKVLEMVCK